LRIIWPGPFVLDIEIVVEEPTDESILIHGYIIVEQGVLALLF
jgi:hypothetical protein